MGDISILGLVAALELRALGLGVPEGVARARGVAAAAVGVAAVADVVVVVDVVVDSKIFCYIICLWQSPNYKRFPQKL